MYFRVFSRTYIILLIALAANFEVSVRAGFFRPFGLFRGGKQESYPESSSDSEIVAFGMRNRPVLRTRAGSLPKAMNPASLKLIISGAPASGKGTQCEMIAKHFGVVHLSTGDILREAVKRESLLGKQAKAFIDEGRLVPDDLVIDLVLDRLMKTDCLSRGFLLDGFPRTPAQAEALASIGIDVDAFLFLDVPENILVERVTGRRLDPQTGKIYHMKFNPPMSAEIHNRLVQRSDDTAEKVRVRYREFMNNIGTIKQYYGDRIVRVDGTAAPQTISQRLVSFLKEMSGLKSRSGDKVSTNVDASSDEEMLIWNFATHSVLA